MVDSKFLSPYKPEETEARIYEMWLKGGFFNPDVCVKNGAINADAETYSIVMPPPNVTGVLHMGHALMITIEDILVRYARMQGKRTLWLPGTDHAAIATQARVEKDIYKKEKKSRHDLGREELLRRIEQFAKESHDTIVEQIKVFGASCDWSREAFTLDEVRSKAVRTMFKKMYDDGLIYRGNRIVNWDPKGQTTISDDEIVYEERKAKLYTFRYAKDFPVPISTTRPETKVGDTAVAVHPDDPRYAQFVGKEYDVIFCGTPLHIKIVADLSVEKEFGTGALGVTPAHSVTDWEIADRHDLPRPQVINEFAKMTVADERLKDKKVTDAREVIAGWLRSEGLLEKEEEVSQNVATAERTGGIVEPLPKLQWFIAVNKEFTLPYSAIDGIPSGSKTTLKTIMRKVVESGATKIIPDHFEKTYFHWIDNLRDWCISRQIWYGHRIPVWYHELRCVPRPGYENDVAKCVAIVVSGDKPLCEFCDGEFIQDPDTLDTWFSSGLWTFSTMGWPEKTKDLEIYHPTSVLETGYEIIFFWIARMILMTGYALGTAPFHTVYLHGTVRDAQGRKMSKSLGNGIDPIDIAKKFGADAGRMALIIGNTPGTDSRISEDKVKAYKHFANKLWNIARFVLTATDGIDFNNPPPLVEKDKVVLAMISNIAQDVSKDISEYRFYIAGEKIYHYIWHTFADKILEESKARLSGTDEADKHSAQYMLFRLLETSLVILHPFMPFITEEIWQSLPERKAPLIVTPYVR
ncbi:MAG: valine--tRNA ligase [Candidatus Lloydbacteria bacterium RIFCSPHIGHO2_02_FULL_50_13]|uniref:Valine--tRNA ligase n=1 Tax=Candidatus Lloydbacteria bacterium RIFCSPHIGHO2_02_FULL_50_13 TaxID=1798661 RepID=A0A1G2DA62_9BACT|nr:MAG: valine--tRNA ligase [Candidatus Lloydbacteria bacterium RIFCSPHIGHO2_02_FULL_50_13]